MSANPEKKEDIRMSVECSVVSSFTAYTAIDEHQGKLIKGTVKVGISQPWKLDGLVSDIICSSYMISCILAFGRNSVTTTLSSNSSASH